jgi:hypothetical protein
MAERPSDSPCKYCGSRKKVNKWGECAACFRAANHERKNPFTSSGKRNMQFEYLRTLGYSTAQSMQEQLDDEDDVDAVE